MPDSDGNTSGVDGGSRDRPRIQPVWSSPKPEHLPRPTYWPAVAALGVTLLVWGLITTWLISVVGLLLVGLSLAGWIGELIDE